MIRRRTWPFAAALLWAACASPEEADEGQVPQPSPPSPAAEPPSGARAAPEAALRTLDGTEVTLADLRGDVAIVNFWGTWCLPCRTELPELAELARAYADDGVRVVGVAIDSGTPDDIRAFAAEFGVDYELWMGEMATAVAEFGAVGYPFTLVVDREGWIRKEYLGPQTYDSLAEDIDPLLASSR